MFLRYCVYWKNGNENVRQAAEMGKNFHEIMEVVQRQVGFMMRNNEFDFIVDVDLPQRFFLQFLFAEWKLPQFVAVLFIDYQILCTVK